jgi:hypothetical protein
MRNLLLIIFCFLYTFGSVAQELNCTVTVNSDQLSQGDLPVFKTLERSLNDFVNKTSWSNRKFTDSERINAQMFITITKYESNRFEGNIQIQSSRPVFNTSYETPILNYKDNSFFFQYIEFQPLIFNENVFDSNLVAVIAFYANMILGMDGDSFALEGGSENLRIAQNIAIQGQGTNFKGWGDSSEDRSRFELIDNMLSNRYREYRVAMYNYHRKGLDILGDNNSTGKQVVMGTMKLFETIRKNDPNSMLTQTFFDAKAEEIVNIFSDGPKVDIVKLKETLNTIAPQFRSSWNKIKF